MISYRFEGVRKDNNCKYCCYNGGFNWGFLCEVFIINISDRVDRREKAEIQAHKVGLCRKAKFFIVDRHKDGFLRGCFDSHKFLCTYSFDNKYYPVLILEDDFYFDDRFNYKGLNSIKRHMDNYLPSNYETLFLGGYFIYTYPISTRIFKCRGTTAHSYIANKPYLKMIKNLSFDKCRVFGEQAAIDWYYPFKLHNKQYCVFPSICYQDNIISDHYTKKKIWKLNNLVLNTDAMDSLPKMIMLFELIVIYLIFILIFKNKFFKKIIKYVATLIIVISLILILWIVFLQKNIYNRIFNLKI